MTTIPTSAAKRAANQKNSQRSTGPGTTAGKAKMRNNALRHGLTSRHPVIDGEDREEYESLRLDLLADWQPVDTHESSIVTEIAGAAWRTMQALRIETETYQNYCEDAALTEDADAETAACFPENAKFFDNLRHNSTTIERRFYRAIAELRKLRTERKKEMRSWLCFAKRYRANCFLGPVPPESNPQPRSDELGFVSQNTTHPLRAKSEAQPPRIESGSVSQNAAKQSDTPATSALSVISNQQAPTASGSVSQNAAKQSDTPATSALSAISTQPPPNESGSVSQEHYL